MVTTSALNDSWFRSVVHGRYFPHIDGIRALAIIPVIAYHLLPSICPGGFTGVDVFFVISGYLITGGILKSQSAGSFSIGEFYKKRIIRIFPAYFVMILGTLLAGAVLYYSGPMRWLGNAALSSSIFISNIFYAKSGSGYFHGINEDSPLLNLWSLSVEEQFYLFIPILLIALARIRTKAWWVFVVIIIGSIALSEHQIRSGDGTSAFFYLQSRTWNSPPGHCLRVWCARSMMDVPNQTRLLPS